MLKDKVNLSQIHQESKTGHQYPNTMANLSYTNVEVPTKIYDHWVDQKIKTKGEGVNIYMKEKLVH